MSSASYFLLGVALGAVGGGFLVSQIPKPEPKAVTWEQYQKVEDLRINESDTLLIEPDSQMAFGCNEALIKVRCVNRAPWGVVP